MTLSRPLHEVSGVGEAFESTVESVMSEELRLEKEEQDMADLSKLVRLSDANGTFIFSPDTERLSLQVSKIWLTGSPKYPLYVPEGFNTEPALSNRRITTATVVLWPCCPPQSELLRGITWLEEDVTKWRKKDDRWAIEMELRRLDFNALRKIVDDNQKSARVFFLETKESIEDPDRFGKMIPLTKKRLGYGSSANDVIGIDDGVFKDVMPDKVVSSFLERADAEKIMSVLKRTKFFTDDPSPSNEKLQRLKL